MIIFNDREPGTDLNKIKKVSFIIVLLEVLIIVLLNILFTTLYKNNGDRLYRVDAQRITNELRTKSYDQINLAKYKTILKVSRFNPEEICNNDYIVVKVNDILYRIEYKYTENNNIQIYMNICMSVLILMTIIILIYIKEKILKPFYNMSNLTIELAKGNLSVPIKEEKSKFFGKFIWGIDMLRDNLEANKQKELELQKDRKTLILSLSHDIKTPLSAIELYSKALSLNLYESSEKKEEALRGIDKNVDEIKGYVNEIVNASREDFINLEVEMGAFYFADMLERIELYYKDKLSLLHTEFVVENISDKMNNTRHNAFKKDNCLLKGDCDRIIEVLQNVMENAIKYGDGKKIEIAYYNEEDCRIVTIENTGCTLKEEEITQIFDSFYRGSNSDNIKGSGLGLYICRNLMKKMDGDIFAEKSGNSNINFKISVVIRKV